MTALTNVTQIHARLDRIDAARTVDGSNPALAASVRGGGAAGGEETSSGRLRLTRRGRVVFGGLATLLVAAGIGVLASFVAPGALASSSVSSQEFPYVVPQVGDSLWSIAAELDPAADTRDVVAEISRLNQLQAGDLQAGEAIAVPLRFEGSGLTFPGSEL